MIKFYGKNDVNLQVLSKTAPSIMESRNLCAMTAENNSSKIRKIKLFIRKHGILSAYMSEANRIRYKQPSFKGICAQKAFLPSFVGQVVATKEGSGITQ
jgi:hypothetical protein